MKVQRSPAFGRRAIDGVSDEITRLALEASPTGKIVTDAAGRILLVNAEAERLFGYAREELLGRSVDLLVPDVVRPRHGAHRAAFLANPETRRMGVGRDLYGPRKDGARIPVEIGLNPIRTRDGLLILTAITDISERRQVLAIIKSDDSLRRIPVVILSSSESEKDITSCYELGANCYIAKPVDLQACRSIVRTLEDFWLSTAKLPPGDGHTTATRIGHGL